MTVTITTEPVTRNVRVEVSRQRGPAGAGGGGPATSIVGLIEAGANVTFTGGGVTGDPFVVNATGGGGGGISDGNKGDITVSSSGTVWTLNSSVLAPYLTTTSAASTYYPLSNPSGFITSAALSPYLTTATASATYATIAALNGKFNTPTGTTLQYLRGDGALATFPTDLSAFANGPGYITTSALSPYLLTSTAANTYAPINNPTFTGTVSGITKSMVGLGNVENTALSTWGGSSNIDTVGTLTNGTWQGTPVADAYIAGAATWDAKQDAITPASDAEVIAGTETTIRSTTPAQMRLAAETWGGGGGAAVEYVIVQSDLPYFTTTSIPGLMGAALNSGSCAAVAGVAGHPGIWAISDSTSANGGYRFSSDLTPVLISGYEAANFVFSPKSDRAGIVFRGGYVDNWTNNSLVDAVWLHAVGNGAGGWTLTGRTRSNSTESVTASAATLTVDAWYSVKLLVNPTATLVTYTVLDSTGATIWTDTLSSNIPTATGRETGLGFSIWESTTDAAAVMIWLDFIKLWAAGTLNR